MTKQSCIHLYDGAFNVDAKKWGTFTSYDKEGKELITSLSEETCVAATRWYLKAKQDGEFTGPETTYTSVVEGKL